MRVEINFSIISIFLSENFVWVPLEPNEVELIESAKTSFEATDTVQKGNMTIIRAKQTAISVLNDIIEKEKRCGELEAFDSLEEAEKYAVELELENKSLFQTPTIDNSAVAKKLKSSISKRNMENFIKSLVSSFKNRYFDSNSGIDSANWIQRKWKEITSSRTDIKIKSYKHTFKQNSVILTVPGSSNDGDIVVLGAHLDSIIIPWPRGTQLNRIDAPGADDDASGITVLTEAIRAIVDAGYRPHKTIQFQAYAKEEKGLKGSKDIAKRYRSEGKKVLGMLNFDMVGYNSGRSKHVVCFDKNNFNNGDQMYFLMKLMRVYIKEVPYGTTNCRRGCSDHASWTRNEYPANMIDECKLSPHWHKKTDTVANLDVNQISRFAQLAVVYVAEIAKGSVKGQETGTKLS